jgi:hypothetical protein
MLILFILCVNYLFYVCYIIVFDRFVLFRKILCKKP